jgi:hypothetical protein
MRRVDLLISASRKATENQEFTATAGIQDEEFLEYLNNGQEEIHSVLQSTFPGIITAYKEDHAVVNQEAYPMPRDLYLGTRIDMIEYSCSGLPTDYYLLKKGQLKERLNTQAGNPAFYIRRGDEILIQPKPQQSGKIRWSYQRSIPKLDVRRATVLAVTLGTNTITSLTLNPAVLLDADALLEQGKITIVDQNGVVKMRDIPIDAIDQSTGVVTISAGFTFQNGETISAGNFACRGGFSSTNSQLPELTEKYLLEYCNARILIRDSQTDAAEVGQILLKVQETLRLAYAEPDNDPDRIPLLDMQFLGVEDYYP